MTKPAPATGKPTPALCFVDRNGQRVRMGAFLPLTAHELRLLVRNYPLHWLELP